MLTAITDAPVLLSQHVTRTAWVWRHSQLRISTSEVNGTHNWQLVLQTTASSVHGWSFQLDIDGFQYSFLKPSVLTRNVNTWIQNVYILLMQMSSRVLYWWTDCLASLRCSAYAALLGLYKLRPSTQALKTPVTRMTENLQRHPLRTINRCTRSFNGSPLYCWNRSWCVTRRDRANKLIKTSFRPINKLSSTHLRHDISILVYLGIWRSSCLREMRGKQKMSIWTFIITSWVFLNN